MQGHLVIAVRDLESGARDYVFPLPEPWLASALDSCDLEPAPGQAGRLEVHAAATGSDFLLQGSVHAEVIASCVRCLEPARVPVDARFEVLMVRKSGLDPSRFEDEDGDWETFEGEQLVLDGLCREQILLEVPMNPLCSPDCAGIPFRSSDSQ